jgi:hypothetical protein
MYAYMSAHELSDFPRGVSLQDMRAQNTLIDGQRSSRVCTGSAAFRMSLALAPCSRKVSARTERKLHVSGPLNEALYECETTARAYMAQGQLRSAHRLGLFLSRVSRRKRRLIPPPSGTRITRDALVVRLGRSLALTKS